MYEKVCAFLKERTHSKGIYNMSNKNYSNVVGSCIVHGKKYIGHRIIVVNDEDVYVDGVQQTAEDGITLDQAAYDRWVERRRVNEAKRAEERAAIRIPERIESYPYGEMVVNPHLDNEPDRENNVPRV